MLWSLWKRKIERRALVYLGLRPHLPAVAADNALDDGQADPAALVILGPVQALEGRKQLVGKAHVETNPIILYKVDSCNRSRSRRGL